MRYAAARALNNDFCRKWSAGSGRKVGLTCAAFSEAHGFGRSRQVYLLLRVWPAVAEQSDEQSSSAAPTAQTMDSETDSDSTLSS